MIHYKKFKSGKVLTLKGVNAQIDRPAEEVRYRYVQFMGCSECRVETKVGECCPKCGTTFLRGNISMNLVRKEVWKPIPRKWWRPSTRDGGEWASCIDSAEKINPLPARLATFANEFYTDEL